MERAAAELDFETAIEMRDKLAELRKLQEDN
jgi:excinuclease ABC subunit B